MPYKRRGDPVISVRIDADTLAQCDALVDHYDANRSYIIRLAITQMCQRCNIRYQRPRQPMPGQTTITTDTNVTGAV